ncbi:PH domain-containing protein [Streptomyces sp. NPDC012403]|uniref:PH domain-containing protein n=1 Tax=unclassified Streptomyces TaxID=2593676 RepID=UPI001C23068E|nr:PH domain-containing protein [Streptomyces sp. AC558_RSS880]
MNADLRQGARVVRGRSGRVVRTYRLRAAQLVFVTLVLGLPGVPLAGTIVPEDDLPVPFKAGMLVLMSTVYLGIAWFWRAATIVYEDHIAVRRLFRTRRTAWADVLGIGVEDGTASSRTLLLDREGRLFALPGGIGARAGEVRAVTDVWERSRGDGWTAPDEAFVLAARERAAARSSAMVLAVFLTVGSFLALLMCGFVLGDVFDWDSDGIPRPFQWIGFVPVVVFPVVYGVAVRRLGRRAGTADVP